MSFEFQGALLQHAKRYVYQASIWSCCLKSQQNVPSPEEFGWTKIESSWKPKWTTLPEASIACSQLLKCGCKMGCAGRCKCVKANLSCTELCYCAAGCTNTV